MSPSYLLAGGVTSCLLLAAPASAQATASSDPVKKTAAPSWTGADIIVTGQRQTYAVPDTSAATKTSTPLIEVPQSVQVLTKTLIEEQDRRTLGEALVNVSGVAPTRSEEVLFTAPIVHGVPAEIYQDSLPFYGATQAANDPTIHGVARRSPTPNASTIPAMRPAARKAVNRLSFLPRSFRFRPSLGRASRPGRREEL